jgi:hypothetical protein
MYTVFTIVEDAVERAPTLTLQIDKTVLGRYLIRIHAIRVENSNIAQALTCLYYVRSSIEKTEGPLATGKSPTNR